MKKILTVLGARPQFIKAAPVSSALSKSNRLKEIIVHTGQHFDYGMSDIFFDELNIPLPKYNLECGGLSHGEMTGSIMSKLEPVITEEKPDVVLVYGDTNSTLAGALTAVKCLIPVAHVESGLRSHNLQMPEEVNRVVTDRVSDFLFCPTGGALRNLKNEGFPFKGLGKESQLVLKTGDVMYDIHNLMRDRVHREFNLKKYNLNERSYVLCTLHRQENLSSQSVIERLFRALNTICLRIPLVIIAHPRLTSVLSSAPFSEPLKAVILPPQSYVETQGLIKNSMAVLTDSGGVQKESFFYGIPCGVLREETEWAELLRYANFTLLGSSLERVENFIESIIENGPAAQGGVTDIFGAGDSAFEIMSVLKDI